MKTHEQHLRETPTAPFPRRPLPPPPPRMQLLLGKQVKFAVTAEIFDLHVEWVFIGLNGKNYYHIIVTHTCDRTIYRTQFVIHMQLLAQLVANTKATISELSCGWYVLPDNHSRV